MDYPCLQVDRPAPHVARLLIDRQAQRNAIDGTVRQSLQNAVGAQLADPSVRAIVLGGVGGTFSSGGDLPSMTGLSRDAARERLRDVHAVCRAVGSAPVPVVTAVEGVAAGGAVGLALLGDHIVAGAGARILFPFLALGLVPDWAQLLTLPRRVGVSVARRLLTAGQPVLAVEALEVGLVDAIVPDEAVMAEAVGVAVRMARLPREAWARTKRRLAGPLDDDLRQEEADQVECLTGPEFAEGFAAFRAKRPPDFAGVLR